MIIVFWLKDNFDLTRSGASVKQIQFLIRHKWMFSIHVENHYFDRLTDKTVQLSPNYYIAYKRF